MTRPRRTTAPAIALACAAALGAVALRDATSPASAQDAAPRPTAVGAFWPEVVVTGVVRGAPRGPVAPLADAWLRFHSGAGICGLSAHTDRRGGFTQRCRNLGRSGDVEVVVRAEGHVGVGVIGRAATPAAGAPTGAPGVIELDIVLTPWRPTPGPSPIIVDGRSDVELAATVVDGSRPGAPPVPGVRVVAAYGEAEPSYICLSPVVTDAAGRFTMSCPQANHLVPIRLRFRADGYAPAEETWFMGFPRRGGPTRVVLRPESTPPPPGAPATPTDPADRLPRLAVSGVVRGPVGAARVPLAGARVSAAGRPGRCAAAAMTADDGSFALRCSDLNWRGALDVDVTPPDARHRPWSATVDLGRPGAWGDALYLAIDLGIADGSPTATATPPATASTTPPPPATATAPTPRSAVWVPIAFARR